MAVYQQRTQNENADCAMRRMHRQGDQWLCREENIAADSEWQYEQRSAVFRRESVHGGAPPISGAVPSASDVHFLQTVPQRLLSGICGS